MVGFFVNFIPAFVDNYRKYQAVNFFKVTMVTFNDLHPLTNLWISHALSISYSIHIYKYEHDKAASSVSFLTWPTNKVYTFNIHVNKTVWKTSYTCT